MIRAVLAVMAGLLCALAGLRRAASMRSAAERLRRWGQVLAHLALILLERTMSLQAALAAAADGTDAPDRLLRGIAQTLQAQPLSSLTDAFLSQCGDVPEKDVLARMFARLARGSLESRVQAIEQAQSEIALMQEQSARKAEKDAKLWQTLGFIGGTCITILLL